MKDLIDRQAAIDALEKWESESTWDEWCYDHKDEAEKYSVISPSSVVFDLPSAQSEPHYDEWCDDCKEYDKERHCCPRWNKVIWETLKDAQPERKTGKWICIDCTDMEGNGVNSWKCSGCGEIYADFTNFCPDCGADMRGGDHDKG